MPTVSDFYPSNYLRCADLKGNERLVTIERVVTELFENDGNKQTKPVVHFKEPGVKPLVLNKTNFMTIAALCGDDSDEWAGKKIVIYPELVPFKGKVTEAVRVRRAASPAQPASRENLEADPIP